MSEQDSQFVPVWDVTKSDTLAFLRGAPEFVDYAACLEPSNDGNGAAFALFTPAGFFAWFGTNPEPFEAIGPAAGNAVDLTNWRSAEADLKEQKKQVVRLRNTLLKWVPDRLLAPMRDNNRSIRTKSTEFIWSGLCAQLGTLTKEDLVFLLQQLKEPYRVGSSVPSFLADWRASLLDLERAQQPLSQIMATDLLMECFGPEFGTCWIAFVKDVPVVANRTVVRLIAAITVFAADALPLITAQTAIGINAVVNQTALVEAMQLQINEMKLALEDQKTSRRDRKRGTAASDGTTAKHQKPSGLFRFVGLMARANI